MLGAGVLPAGPGSGGSGGGWSPRLALRLGRWLETVSGLRGLRIHLWGGGEVTQVDNLGGIHCFLRCLVLCAHQKKVCRKTDFIMSTGAGEGRDTGWDFCIPRKMIF